MKRFLPAIPLIVLVVLGILFATFALNRQVRYSPDVLVGKPMPALTLPSLVSGEPIPLASLVDRPVLINYFASWCPPCIVEHPNLMALKARGVRIIGVAYKDDPAATRGFLERHGNPFDAVIVDREGLAGIEFGVTAPPETFLVGKDRMIVSKQIGAIETPAQMEGLLRQVLAAR